jgi:hypothetical protein
MNFRNTIKSRIKTILAESDDIIIDEENLDAWSGGDNLSLDIDHSKAAKSEEVTSSPETLSIVDDRGVFRMAESKLRQMIREILGA